MGGLELDSIIDHRETLEKISNMDEWDIVSIWIKPGEPKIMRFEHDPDNYLYQKMLLRFRIESRKRLFGVLNGVPTSEWKLFTNYFRVNNEKFTSIIKFFIWLGNMWTPGTLSKEFNIPLEELNLNGDFELFFDLPHNIKIQLLEKFNTQQRKYLI